jgi:methyl-accepting chemotaxis protein
MKSKQSLGKFIGKLLFGITLLTIIVLMVCSYASTKKLLTTRNQLSQQSAVDALVTSNHNLQSSTNSELEKLAGSSIFNQQNYNAKTVRQALNMAKKGNTQMEQIEFGSTKGEMITFTKLPTGFDPRVRPWYEGAIKEDGKVFWTAPYQDAGTGKMLTTAAIAVKDKQGQVIGVLGIDLSYNNIQKTISALNVGRTGSVSLVSNNGTVIASKGKSKNYTFNSGKNIKTNTVFKAIAAADKKTGILEVNDKSIGQVYYNKQGSEWSFAVVDHNDLNKELHSLIVISLVVTLIMLLIVILYAIYSSKVIKETVAIYIKRFEAASQGQFDKIKPFKGGSVLGFTNQSSKTWFENECA